MPAKKRALVIGINYAGTGAELRGAVNDALHWTEVLTTHLGFKKTEVTTMIDEYPSGETVEEDDTFYARPTKHAILEALDWLVDDAWGGDALVFAFSGHGTQVPDASASEGERLDEALCPVDWDEFTGLVPYRLITDDILHSFFTRLPPGVLLTVVCDCCTTFNPIRVPLLLDSEFLEREFENEATTQGDYRKYRFKCDAWLKNQHVSALPRRLPCEPQRPLWSRMMRWFSNESGPRLDEGVAVFSITACRAQQSAIDAYLSGIPQGVLTYCLLGALDVLKYKCTYLELLETMNRLVLDLRVEVMPYIDQYFQLAYTQNAAPDECTVFELASGFVAKDKARRRRGQRFRLA